jgi:lipoprotein-releasing system ATP-binding protein
MKKRAVLSSHNLQKQFVEGSYVHHVLRGVSTSFTEGETYGVIGASGSGKSTLLHLLAGLDEPSGGHVTFNDTNINTMSAAAKDAFRTESIGLVFQFHYLVGELNALENVILPGLIRGKPREECEAHALELFEHVGMLDRMKHYPYQLSGGQQQRVAILRALFNKPRFLIADEPTGSLDAENAQQVLELFLRCQSEYGMGLIICTHDMAISKHLKNSITIVDGLIVS